jgi:hypothetical protein
MSAHNPYDEENETEKAWFWVVVSHMGGGKSDIKEIARLLRLGQPIPKIAQDFLADLLPPRGGGEDVKLVLKPHDRRGKLKRELQEFQKVVQIVAAMNRGKGLTAACEEVMPQGGGFRLMKPWREVLEQHPELVGWLLESFAEFTDKKPPTVTDKQ